MRVESRCSGLKFWAAGDKISTRSAEIAARKGLQRQPFAKRLARAQGADRTRGPKSARSIATPVLRPFSFSSSALGLLLGWLRSKSSRNKSQRRVELPHALSAAAASRGRKAWAVFGGLWQGGGVCSASFRGNRGSIRLQGSRGSSRVFPNDPRRCCGQTASDPREAAIAGLRHGVRRDQRTAVAPWMHDSQSRRRRRINGSHWSQARKG